MAGSFAHAPIHPETVASRAPRARCTTQLSRRRGPQPRRSRSTSTGERRAPGSTSTASLRTSTGRLRRSRARRKRSPSLSSRPLLAPFNSAKTGMRSRDEARHPERRDRRDAPQHVHLDRRDARKTHHMGDGLMAPRRTYDPKAVEISRERARRGDPIIRPIALHAQIEYRCSRCNATYMGDTHHVCPQRRAP